MDAGTQNLNEAARLKALLAEAESALKGLAKLLVGIRFYPPGHPALQDVTREAQKAFAPLLATRESVTFVVRRDGFSFEDRPVAPDNQMLQKLAAGLFARRVQRLVLLADLSCRDLWEAAQIFLQDADALHKGGGVQAALTAAEVTTLWANVVDLGKIFESRREIESARAASGAGPADDETFLASLAGAPAGAEGSGVDEGIASAGESDPAGEAGSNLRGLVAPRGAAVEAPARNLGQLLDELGRTTGEQDFADLLQQLPPLFKADLQAGVATTIVRALTFLAEQSAAAYTGIHRRQALRQTFADISTPELFQFYISLLCERGHHEQQQEWQRISNAFGEPFFRVLMARLASEEDQSQRKFLYDLLTSHGEAAVPAIVPALQDERWYVVRNAVCMLGEIRVPTTVEKLRPVLQHPDVRVRREVIRALTRVGGTNAVNLLLRTLQGEDAEMRRQAMLSLGAMKNLAAVPVLVQYVVAPDWRFRFLDAKKDALRALGEIGCVDAVPAIGSIVRTKRIIFRGRNDDLRIAAIAALAAIGGEAAEMILSDACARNSAAVCRAAAHALKQLRKAGTHE